MFEIFNYYFTEICFLNKKSSVIQGCCEFNGYFFNDSSCEKFLKCKRSIFKSNFHQDFFFLYDTIIFVVRFLSGAYSLNIKKLITQMGEVIRNKINTKKVKIKSDA